MGSQGEVVQEAVDIFLEGPTYRVLARLLKRSLTLSRRHRKNINSHTHFSPPRDVLRKAFVTKTSTFVRQIFQCRG